MRFLYIIYLWIVALPLLLVATLLTAIITIVGCFVGNGDFWGYYPGRIWSRLFCALLLIRIEVEGREYIDRGTSYVFVANHQGAFDIFLIYGYLGHNFKWMMKRSIQRIPFVGRACKAAGFIFVDKKSKIGVKQTMQVAERTLKQGMSLVIFPEGSRTYDGKLQPFKKGAYAMAVDLSLPVVPLTINGSFEVMPRTSYSIHPAKMRLTIHPPIHPDAESGHTLLQLMEESRQAIASALWEEKE